MDYITKPFVIGALQRKIKAMFAMLEHHKPAKDIYDDGRLFLDFSEQTASLNGKPLTLSPMEYKMLNLFRKNPRQVLTRGQLLERLWDIDERFVDEHTLTTSISRIRSKIESDGGAADGRGAAVVRPCGDFCTDTGVWKAAVAVYR